MKRIVRVLIIAAGIFGTIGLLLGLYVALDWGFELGDMGTDWAVANTLLALLSLTMSGVLLMFVLIIYLSDLVTILRENKRGT